MSRVQVVCVVAGFAGLMWAAVNMVGPVWDFAAGAAVAAAALVVFNASGVGR